MLSRKKLKSIIAITCIVIIILAIGATVVYAITHKQTDSSNNNSNSAKADNKNTSNKKTNKEKKKNNDDLSDKIQALDISLDINNGGVEILPASSDKITADYDDQYYDVEIGEESGKWIVAVKGKVEKMGKTSFVQLYIPEVQSKLEVNVLNGDFNYELPENCEDVITITAKNAGISITSNNQYENSEISLTAEDKMFLKYGMITYPDYFTTTKNGFEYSNGTKACQISILLTGYTSVSMND